MMNSLQVPWEKFTEEQIHLVLATTYTNLDYHVENLHKSDRANEAGADLVVKKVKRSIAIAVKIKPNNNDRYQLIELSERKEQKKIYAYIETPTASFKKVIDKYKGVVEFWDRETLNRFMIENDLYFAANLIFDHSEAHRIIDSICYLLLKLWRNCDGLKKKKIKQLDKHSFLRLWRLKDVAVTLHQSNATLRVMLEEKMPFKNQEFDTYFLHLLLIHLEYMATKIQSFICYFSEFYKEHQNLVNNSIIEQSNRSHWFWIAGFNPMTRVEVLERDLKQLMGNIAFIKEHEKKNEPDKRWEDYVKEQSKTNSVWAAMEYQVRELMKVGDGIEHFVDDIIEEYLGEHRYLGYLKQKDEML